MPKKNKTPFDGFTIETVVFGVILLLLFFLVCRLFAPFFTVFLWSVLLYIIINPLHSKITGKLSRKTLGGRFLRNILAGVFAIVTVLIVLIPLLFVVREVYEQAIQIFDSLKTFISDHNGAYSEFYQKLRDNIYNITGIELGDSLQLEIQRLILPPPGQHSEILSIMRVSIEKIGIFLLGMALILFCLFFYYLDASYLSELVKSIIPIKNDYTKTIFDKFKDIVHTLVLGYLSVAAIQAVLAFIIFKIFKVQGSLVFACLTFVCVFIPMIGGALVWLPLGIKEIAAGDVTGGIAFIIICAICISFMDNFLRPFFLHDRLKLHPLLIFFGIMGGIVCFGFNGLILGPLIIVLFLTVLELFFKEHNIKKEGIKTLEEMERLEEDKKDLKKGLDKLEKGEENGKSE